MRGSAATSLMRASAPKSSSSRPLVSMLPSSSMPVTSTMLVGISTLSFIRS